MFRFFFDFDLWPKISSDLKILKLHYLGIETEKNSNNFLDLCIFIDFGVIIDINRYTAQKNSSLHGWRGTWASFRSAHFLSLIIILKTSRI